MLNDADILSTLTELFGEGQRKAIVSRLYRLPSIWQSLRDPNLLSKAAEQLVPEQWLPGRLLALAFDYPDLASLADDGLVFEGDHTCAETACTEDNLRDTAALSVQLLAMVSSPKDNSELGQTIRTNPELWTAPLACAWPELMAGTWLQDTFPTCPTTEQARMIATVLLSNMDILAAAQILVGMQAEKVANLLPVLRSAGFEQLHAALGQLSIEKLPEVDGEPEFDPSGAWLTPAVLKSVSGDTEGAHLAFKAAWERSSAVSARIADRLADVARSTSDPVLEVEARRQALESSGSPDRRAALARSLIELERYEDAKNILLKPETAAEQIAAGALSLHLGDRSRAIDLLLKAVQDVSGYTELGDDWKLWLKELLVEAGELASAIEVQQERCHSLAAQPGMMLELATLYADSGDPASSAACAEIAAALDPASLEATRILAESLQRAGRAEHALKHWMRISEAQPELWPQVGRCAIEAGDAEIALGIASKALTSDPDSTEAQILIGKAYTLKGDFESARTYLERAVDQSPDQPEAWISLAEAQTACGEHEAAGVTLQKAVQSTPGDGRVHIARARWLKTAGQLSQALDHTRIAVGIEPDQSEWRIEQAEILRDLGQVDEALPELRAALAAQPGNWRARESLALAYELKGELPSAAHLLDRIPEDILPASKLIVGRILVKSSEDDDAIRQAVELLVSAHKDGLEDRSLWYWLAEAYERSGLTAQAVESFQAYLDDVKDEDHPLQLDAYNGFARTAITSGQIERASEMLERALREFPTSHEVLCSLANTYLASGRHSESEQAARQAVELQPSDVESLQILRDAVLAQDKREEAISLQEKIIAGTPGDVEALRTLAEIEHAGEQFEGARSVLAKAILMARSSPKKLLKLSQTAHSFGRPRLAHMILKRAARLDPQNRAAQKSLAETSEALDDLETAQSSWLAYAALQKQDPYPLKRGAQALWKLGRRSASVGLLERALQITDSARQHFDLAEALRMTNQAERSLEHYRLAAEKVDADTALRISISEAMYDLGRLEEAKQVLSMATAPDQEYEIHLIKAKRALEQSDLDTASKQIHDARSADDSSPMLRSIEVQLARAQGKRDASERGLQELLSMDMETERECVGAVEAALSLNAWPEAVLMISKYLENHPLSDKLAETILVLSHRLRDIDWLYAIACEAENHSPLTSATGIEQLLESVSHLPSGIAPNTAHLVETWEAMQNGDTSSEIIERIPSTPTPVQPMLLEAGAIALLKANRPARALELLEARFSRDTRGSHCVLLQGIARTMLKQYQQAAKLLDSIVGDLLLQPLALYLQSEALRKAGNESDSLSKLNAALAQWPEESSWHYNLAQRYLGAERTDAALPHLQQAVENDPENGDYLIALARAYRDVGQLKDALACFANGVQSSPKSSQIWKEAGEVALAAGDLNSAEAWLERACTLAPSDSICAIQSARTALARGDIKTAVKRGQAALRMQPDNAEVLSGMGEILAADGKIEKAIQLYDMALKSADENVEIRLARSTLLAQSGRPEEAAAELETIVDSAPDHDRAWAHLARVQIDNGQLDHALQAANQAIKLSPRNVQHMLLLGQICRMNGQLDRSLSILSDASKYAPEEASIARELGKVHEIRREHSAALEAYHHALEINPDDVETLIEAGLILKAIKVYDQAGELFERAVKINPVDPQALQQLATIRALQLIHGGVRETEAVPS